MGVDSVILKNKQLTLSYCSTFKSKIGMGLPKTGIIFYWGGN